MIYLKKPNPYVRREERVTEYSKYASELSDSIKGRKFLDQLRNCQNLEHHTVIKLRLYRIPLQPQSSKG